MNSTLLETINLQQQASSPYISACVFASAGSGKTKILIDKILRLMLNGASIDTILCITFTNTAANEMRERLQKKLLTWFLCDDDIVIEELNQLIGTVPSKDMIIHARNLHKDFCNKISQIKIKTLHSFCKDVLELAQKISSDDLHINFKNQEIKILNALENERFITDAFNEALHILSRQNSRYVNILTECYDYTTLLKTTIDALEREDKVKKFLEIIEIPRPISLTDSMNFLDRVYLKTIEEFGIPVRNNESAESIIGSYILQINYQQFIQIAEILSHKNEELASKINWWIRLDHKEKVQNFDFFRLLFLTKNLKPRARLFIGSDIKESDPFISEFLLEEQRKVYELQQRLSNLELASTNGAFRILLIMVKLIYDDLKLKNGYICYNDLIDDVALLLGSQEGSSTLLYNLDIKINHILIDEAQDLSASQWTIITALVDEFCSGISANDNINRTLFIVGDLKQSVYSFHGAVPQIFYDSIKLYERKLTQAGKQWRNISIDACFRCAPKIISLVNNFIEIYGNSNTFIADVLYKHYAVNKKCGGVIEIFNIDDISDEYQQDIRASAKKIELFDAMQSSNKNQQKPSLDLNWNIEYTAEIGNSTSVKDAITAQAIVSKITQKLQYAHPKDIMILFRKRCGLLIELVKHLKLYNIPLQDLTKNDITNSLDMQDLLAIAKFVVNPFDEMNFAILLKGPLFNLDDQDLLKISYGRKCNLFKQIEIARPNLFKIVQFIIDLYKKNIDCIAFYSALIFYNDDICLKFIQKNNTQIAELLENFWAIIEQFETEQKNHSVQDFVNWFDSGQAATLANRPQIDEQSVKIITVHGAKGMEAPIVILADAQMSENSPIDRIIWENDCLPLIGKIQESRIAQKEIIYRAHQEAKQAENLRLLYVAITRAKDELYVAGAEGRRICRANSIGATNDLDDSDTANVDKTKQNWYEIIKKCMVSDKPRS